MRLVEINFFSFMYFMCVGVSTVAVKRFHCYPIRMIDRLSVGLSLHFSHLFHAEAADWILGSGWIRMIIRQHLARYYRACLTNSEDLHPSLPGEVCLAEFQ